MQKIHQVGYGSIFSRDFKISTIDKRLNELEIDEKLTIIDKVIDYLLENFRDLASSTRMKANSPKRKGSKGQPDLEDSEKADEAQMMQTTGTISAKQAMKNH